RPIPRFSLFPYTTLFRSRGLVAGESLPLTQSSATEMGSVQTITLVGCQVGLRFSADREILDRLFESVGPSMIREYVLLCSPTTKDRKSTRLNSSHVAISY